MNTFLLLGTVMMIVLLGVWALVHSPYYYQKVMEFLDDAWYALKKTYRKLVEKIRDRKDDDKEE